VSLHTNKGQYIPPEKLVVPGGAFQGSWWSFPSDSNPPDNATKPAIAVETNVNVTKLVVEASVRIEAKSVFRLRRSF
jgi:hypothetical protein